MMVFGRNFDALDPRNKVIGILRMLDEHPLKITRGLRQTTKFPPQLCTIASQYTW
jgi:hypothetical protein